MAIWAEIKKALNSTLGTSGFKSLDVLITTAQSALATAISTVNTTANNIKTYTATNNTANKTGILSQKSAYIISLLENTRSGLNSIKNKSAVKRIQTGVTTNYHYGTDTTDAMFDAALKVTINSVNTAKCLVFVSSLEKSNFDGSGTGVYSYYLNGAGHLDSSTVLRILPTRTRNGDYYSKAFWQVIEFY